MKLLYISFGYANYKNKVNAQTAAFKSLGLDCYLIALDKENNEQYIYFYKMNGDQLEVIKKKKIPTLTLKSFFIYKKEIHQFFKDILKDYNFDYCYIRRLVFDLTILSKTIRYLSKNTKILYEWPTVPLDKYASAIKNFAQRLEVLYYRVFVKRWVYKEIVILQDDIQPTSKTYAISNCIDIHKFSLHNDKPELNDTIHFVGIAHLMNWHGYDRFIESMRHYKGKDKITFTIISQDTEENLRLKTMVKEYGLEDQVIFKDRCTFAELDQLIDQYHIALGGLGYHRRGAKYDTSIKNKEYCAWSIPFVCACLDQSFTDEFKYLYKVQPNESIIDIQAIIDWYKKLYNDNYREEMYEYAKDHLGFEKEYKALFNK